jgi:hypothetical protein
MPGAGQSRFMNRGRHHRLPTPDARRFPDGFSHFNRGPIEVLDGDQVVTVQAGKLPIRGGHTGDRGRNLHEAVEFLHREGRPAHRSRDIGLIGVASAVDVPAGAVMFNGFVAHGLTAAEAEDINSTTFSAELWDDPRFNDKVFAGAVRVDFTAWPYPSPLAAGVDDEECLIVWFLDEDGRKQCGPVDEVAGCGGDCQRCVCGEQREPVEVVAVPIEAEVTEAEAAEMRSDIEALQASVEELARALAEMRLADAVEEFGLDQRVDGHEERLRELEEEANQVPVPEGAEEKASEVAG